MNIVYVTDSEVNPNAGGIARITYVMAETLRTNFGHDVFFYRGQEDFVNFIRSIGSCIIIVQSPCKLAREVFESMPTLPSVRIINAFHGAPGFELVPLKREIIKYRLRHNIDCQWTLKQFMLQIGMSILPKKCFTHLLAKKYSLPYGKADKMVVLSRGIIDQYQSIAPGYKDHFVVIPNALSFDHPKLPAKEKEVLVVARLDDWHKRISEILEIWKDVQQDKRFSDWTLHVVGDGIDKPGIARSIDLLSKSKCLFDDIYFRGLGAYHYRGSTMWMYSNCV